MYARISALMGATLAIALVIAGLWGWGAARALVERTDNPDTALWAVRSAAVAALAGAQVLGLTFVTALFYERDRSGEWMRLIAGFVCTAAFVAAITMGLVSR